MMAEDAQDQQAELRDVHVAIAIIIAYHAALVGLMLWGALSDPARFERVMNDPENRWFIVSGGIVLLAVTPIMSYYLLRVRPAKRRATRNSARGA